MVDVLPPMGAYPKWEVNGTATEGYITISVMQSGSIFVKQEMKSGAKTLLKTLQAISNTVSVKEEPMDEDDLDAANNSSAKSSTATSSTEPSNDQDPSKKMKCFIRINLNKPTGEWHAENTGQQQQPMVVWPNLSAASMFPVSEGQDEESSCSSSLPDIKMENDEGEVLTVKFEENSNGFKELPNTATMPMRDPPRSNAGRKPESLQCKICNRIYPTVAQFHIHARKCGVPEATRESISSETKSVEKSDASNDDDDLPTFECQICLAQYGTKQGLQQHMEKAHGIKDLKYQCAQCFVTFHSLKLLQLHPCIGVKGAENSSTDADGFECGLCKLLFTSKKDLDEHWNEKHSQLFPCPQCPKRFKSQADLDKHSTRHATASCDLCGKIYKYKSRLKKHQCAAHKAEEVRAVPCEKCGKLYKGPDCLKEHMVAMHDAPGRFTCQECGKHFWLARRLEMHMRNHTGEKPYQCTICGKAFPLASSLYVHSKSHVTERKYKCKLCNTSYKTKYYLMEHMKGHDPSHSVQCDLCGKSFKSKWSLKVHHEIHMDRRKYKCDICGTAYNNSGSLYTHKKKHKLNEEMTE